MLLIIQITAALLFYDLLRKVIFSLGRELGKNYFIKDFTIYKSNSQVVSNTGDKVLDFLKWFRKTKSHNTCPNCLGYGVPDQSRTPCEDCKGKGFITPNDLSEMEHKEIANKMREHLKAEL